MYALNNLMKSNAHLHTESTLMQYSKYVKFSIENYNF